MDHINFVIWIKARLIKIQMKRDAPNNFAYRKHFVFPQNGKERTRFFCFWGRIFKDHLNSQMAPRFWAPDWLQKLHVTANKERKFHIYMGTYTWHHLVKMRFNFSPREQHVCYCIT